jgi:hypothetical protein
MGKRLTYLVLTGMLVLGTSGCAHYRQAPNRDDYELTPIEVKEEKKEKEYDPFVNFLINAGSLAAQLFLN